MTSPRRSGFARNVLTLMAGTSLAQAIAVAISPILTRLYTPADFGVYASLSALTNLAAVVATGRYEVAVPLPEAERAGGQLMALAASLSAAVGLLSLAIVLVFGDSLAVLVGGAQLRDWLYLVPAIVFVLALTQVMQYWLIRRQSFRSIALAGIMQASCAAAANLALAPLHRGPLGLVMGLVAGQTAGLCVLLFYSWRFADLRPPRASLAGMREQAREHAKFPLFDLPNALSYALSQRGILVLITSFFTASAVGMYSLTERVVLSPFTILTGAYGQVLYQKLAETWRTDRAQFGTEISRAMTQLATLLALPFLVLAAGCKLLVPIVFGNRWTELYLYVLIMAPNAFLTLVVAPASNVLRIVDRQDVSLLLNARLFITRFAALAAAYELLGWGVLHSLLVLSSVTFVVVLVNIRTVLRHAGHPLPRLLLVVGAAALAWYAAVAFMLPSRIAS
jgi:O-antigen/teichoic acid export membrane protein